MAFRVLDNNMPADRTVHWKLTDDAWKTSVFSTFKEAKEYVELWLGEQYKIDLDNLSPGTPVRYSEGGDTVLVVEID